MLTGEDAIFNIPPRRFVLRVLAGLLTADWRISGCCRALAKSRTGEDDTVLACIVTCPPFCSTCLTTSRTGEDATALACIVTCPPFWSTCLATSRTGEDTTVLACIVTWPPFCSTCLAATWVGELACCWPVIDGTLRISTCPPFCSTCLAATWIGELACCWLNATAEICNIPPFLAGPLLLALSTANFLSWEILGIFGAGLLIVCTAPPLCDACFTACFCVLVFVWLIGVIPGNIGTDTGVNAGITGDATTGAIDTGSTAGAFTVETVASTLVNATAEICNIPPFLAGLLLIFLLFLNASISSCILSAFGARLTGLLIVCIAPPLWGTDMRETLSTRAISCIGEEAAALAFTLTNGLLASPKEASCGCFVLKITPSPSITDHWTDCGTTLFCAGNDNIWLTFVPVTPARPGRYSIVIFPDGASKIFSLVPFELAERFHPFPFTNNWSASCS